MTWRFAFRRIARNHTATPPLIKSGGERAPRAPQHSKSSNRAWAPWRTGVRPTYRLITSTDTHRPASWMASSEYPFSCISLATDRRGVCPVTPDNPAREALVERIREIDFPVRGVNFPPPVRRSPPPLCTAVKIGTRARSSGSSMPPSPERASQSSNRRHPDLPGRSSNGEW